MQVVDDTDKLSMPMRRAIDIALSWIPDHDFQGIEQIRVQDEMPGANGDSPVWHKVAEQGNFLISGVYSGKTKKQRPYIVLFVKALFFPFPIWLRWLSFVPALYIARILAHEIAHHMIAERGFVFTPDESYPTRHHEEEFADRYAFSIVNRMKEKRRYRIASKIIKHISRVYFELGREQWLIKNYDGSSGFWYKSWLLDPENQTTVEWYWRARRAAKNDS